MNRRTTWLPPKPDHTMFGIVLVSVALVVLFWVAVVLISAIVVGVSS